MDRLESGLMLKRGALLVAEHYHKRQLAERYGRLDQIRYRRYGDSSISIYRAGAIDV